MFIGFNVCLAASIGLRNTIKSPGLWRRSFFGRLCLFVCWFVGRFGFFFITLVVSAVVRLRKKCHSCRHEAYTIDCYGAGIMLIHCQQNYAKFTPLSQKLPRRTEYRDELWTSATWRRRARFVVPGTTACRQCFDLSRNTTRIHWVISLVGLVLRSANSQASRINYRWYLHVLKIFIITIIIGDRILNFLDCILIGIFHWENVLNFHGRKMGDTSKDGTLLGLNTFINTFIFGEILRERMFNFCNVLLSS